MNYSREEGASDHGAGHEVGVDVELGGIDEDAGRRREGTDEEAVVGQLGRLVGRGARLEDADELARHQRKRQAESFGFEFTQIRFTCFPEASVGPVFFFFSQGKHPQCFKIACRFLLWSRDEPRPCRLRNFNDWLETVVDLISERNVRQVVRDQEKMAKKPTT